MNQRKLEDRGETTEQLLKKRVPELEQQLAAEKARANRAESVLFEARVSQQMCVGAAGIGDFSELCGWIDDVKKRLAVLEKKQ